MSTYYIQGVVLRVSHFTSFHPPSYPLREFFCYYHFVNEETEAKNKRFSHFFKITQLVRSKARFLVAKLCHFSSVSSSLSPV